MNSAMEATQGEHGTSVGDDRSAVVVEPLVDFLAPASLRECVLGCLRAPAQLWVQAADEFHDERGRCWLGRRAGFLADGERAHVQAAVYELCLDGDERQAVAPQRLDDACLERSLIGVT